MSWSRLRYFVLGAVVLALVAELVSAVVIEQQTAGYQSRVAAAQTQVDSDLAAAAKAGYTANDLKPSREQVAQIRSRGEPLAPWQRPSFYAAQAADLSAADRELKQSEATIDANAKTDLDQQVTAAKAGIDQARSLDVPDQTVSALAARLDGLTKAQAGAKGIVDMRKAAGDARQLVADVTAADQQQQAENTAIQSAAQALVQAQGGSIDAIRKLGTDALTNGRNDASVAAYESKPGRFAPFDQVMSAYNRIEHYAPRLGASDVNQAATAAAALQRYAGQIHDLVTRNMGPKHIVVSFSGQHVWAYEGAKVVMDTLATTGIRGVTDYGTDFGPMKVLYTEHPHTMHSPYPKTSPYWYPDTVVQWTVFFTTSGESFHDASWEPDWQLGPGSQYDASTRSHGCVHIPYSLAQWLYGWADVGTPVDIVPMDGQPVATQLSLMTTDNQGNPLSPA